jgi:formylglycine-generating enzyme required for sulfatase activity
MEKIGAYEPIKRISRDEIGVEYLGVSQNGHKAVIKILSHFSVNENFVSGFYHEAELAQKLVHPNIARILDFGEDNARLYIATEYVEGLSLAEAIQDDAITSDTLKLSTQPQSFGKTKIIVKKARLQSKIHFSVKDIILIMRQIADALQAASKPGLVHHDMKAKNIILDKNGDAKLLGLGILKQKISMRLKRNFSPYMSPEEQDGSRKIDIRSNLYSLGAIAWHLLEGRPPFYDSDTMKQMGKMPEPKDASSNLRLVIAYLLSKKPKDRYQKASELIDDLDRIAKANPPLLSGKSSRPLSLALWSFLLIIVICATSCIWYFQYCKEFQKTKSKTENNSFYGNIEREDAKAILKIALPSDLKKATGASYASISGLSTGSRKALNQQNKWVRMTGLPLEVEAEKTGIRLRLIPSGTFKMGSRWGSEAGRDINETQHQVTLTKPFYCGKFEITQGQWKRVTGSNPSNFESSGNAAPVERVTWRDCQDFLDKLCDLEGVPRGTYRLLTEAEWEYACRAGTRTAFCYGNNLDSRQANFNGNFPYGEASKGVHRKKTVKVGSFAPNAFGLYDMHGNVREWCNDWFENYRGSETDPIGASKGSEKIIRGGSWDDEACSCRSAARGKGNILQRSFNCGLRIARKLK